MRADSLARGAGWRGSFQGLFGVLLFILVGLSLPGCQDSVSRIRGEDLKPFSEGTLTLQRSEDKQAQAYYHFILGNLYAENDQESQALEEVQKALALKPDSPGLEFSLARLYIKTQKIPEALDHVRRALELDPKFQDGYYLLAEIHISQGRWEGALEAYQKLAALNPRDEEILFNLGVLYLQLKKTNQGLEQFQKLVDVNPNSEKGHYFLAKIHQDLKQYDRARHHFQETIKINPNHENAYLGLGTLFDITEQPKQAMTIYQKVLQINPGNLEAQEKAGDQYLKQGKFEAGHELLQALKKNAGRDFDTRFRIGIIYLENKRFDQAASEFSELLAERPAEDRVKYFLANTWIEQRQYGKAEEILGSISRPSDYYPQSLILKSYILEKEKKIKEAIQLLQSALMMMPKKIELYLALASLYEQDNHLQESKKILLEGIEMDPDLAELYFRLGALLDKMGQKKESLNQLKTAVKKDPFHVQALNYLGYTYAERGSNLDEAETLIKRALKFRPNDGFILDSLGWVYFKKKKYDEALIELEKAWKLAPNDPVIGEHLGDAFGKKNNWEKALKTYRRVLELTPPNKDKEAVLKKIKEAQQKVDEEKAIGDSPNLY